MLYQSGNSNLPHEKDLLAIVSIVDSIAEKKELPIFEHPYQKVLAKQVAKLFQTIERFTITPQVSYEDIFQQVVCEWVSAMRSFSQNRPKIHFRQYLIRRAMWSICDWLERELRLCSIKLPEGEKSYTPQDDRPISQKLMEAVWAGKLPASYWYLLYLSKIEGLSTGQIGRRINYERHAVGRYLAIIRQEVGL